MDGSIGENNEEQLPSASDIVGDIDEHMFNLDELNILGIKDDRNIVSNLIDDVDIESPNESLNANDDNQQQSGGEISAIEKPAKNKLFLAQDGSNIAGEQVMEEEVTKSKGFNLHNDVVEVELNSHVEEGVDRKNEELANIENILISDVGNLSSLPSIPTLRCEQGIDVEEDGRDKNVTEDNGCKSSLVSETSQSDDVELVQAESSEEIQLKKQEEVVALNRSREKTVVLKEVEVSEVKETENDVVPEMEVSDNTSVVDDISASNVSENVPNSNTEGEVNLSNVGQDNERENVAQVTNSDAESSRGTVQRKQNATPLSLSVSPSLETAEEVDDGNTGRPRRKAARKAGNKIKKIVSSEEDMVEGVSERKESEDSPEAKGTFPKMICFQCCRLRSCQYHLLVNGASRYMCSTLCFQAFRKNHSAKSTSSNKTQESELKNSEVIPSVEAAVTTERKSSSAPVTKPVVKDKYLTCASCASPILPQANHEKKLSWETMEFCNENCLGKYQNQLGSNCAQCKVPVQKVSMGKYCVRFGYNIKQFCCATCLEEFKKGLKTCTYCQKDISSGSEGFLAPVGDKGQFKDFCSSACMEKYDHISRGTRPPIKIDSCAVCNKARPMYVELIAGRLSKDTSPYSKPSVYGLCSEPCFAAFKYVNQLKTEQCEACMRQIDISLTEEKTATFFHDGRFHCCCKACLNVYILTHRKIMQCSWCRVRKYNFDMIKKVSSAGKVLMTCSLNCLNLFQVSMSALSSLRMNCDYCNQLSSAQYHLTMSDATVRNFCSYDCVMTFQTRYNRTPLSLPEESISADSELDPSALPVNMLTQSLTTTDPITPTDPDIIPTSLTPAQPDSVMPEAKVSEPINGMAARQIIVKPPSPKLVKNKITSCKPTVVDKSVSCQPLLTDSSTQTDESSSIALVPVPVPIYVPMPMLMYSCPYPVPMPFPLPIPVPIVIPSTKSYEEIKKRAQEFESVAPEEAEILMMAELVASEEPKALKNVLDLSPPIELDEIPSPPEDCENQVQSDVASDSESEDRWEPVDLEQLIVTSSVVGPAYVEETSEEQQLEIGTRQKRKANERLEVVKPKRPHLFSEDNADESEPAELKAYLGVNAWSSWVQQKNAELSNVASNSIRLKLFKTDLLQMNLEELNYALCLFVKEVRKPGGEMYAADTIFYFCLGIQHYLAENGRLDNIFTDLYFEKFTECLDRVALTFPPLTKESRLFSTRVSEEHLWESRQLGAHSPYVLLSTLVFFNTKYFHLWTVEDHAKLRFASVVKGIKKGRGRPSAETLKAGCPGNRISHSILRYTHPDSITKVFEQHENLETPLRCPVKLYEFYLSRCPEPIKRDGAFFYLLPERACVPDSPVWYSSIALGFDALGKILHRIKMVKEICEAYVDDALS